MVLRGLCSGFVVVIGDGGPMPLPGAPGFWLPPVFAAFLGRSAGWTLVPAVYLSVMWNMLVAIWPTVLFWTGWAA